MAVHRRSRLAVRSPRVVNRRIAASSVSDGRHGEVPPSSLRLSPNGTQDSSRRNPCGCSPGNGGETRVSPSLLGACRTAFRCSGMRVLQGRVGWGRCIKADHAKPLRLPHPNLPPQLWGKASNTWCVAANAVSNIREGTEPAQHLWSTACTTSHGKTLAPERLPSQKCPENRASTGVLLHSRQSTPRPPDLVGLQVCIRHRQHRIIDAMLARLAEHVADDVIGFNRAAAFQVAHHRGGQR